MQTQKMHLLEVTRMRLEQMQKGSSESSVSDRREARRRDTSKELRLALREDMEAED